jgi:hypothetical protein
MNAFMKFLMRFGVVAGVMLLLVGALAGFGALVQRFGLWPVGILVFIILALNFCIGDYK